MGDEKVTEASQDSSLVRYQSFFSRIEPQLQAARNLEDELNRRLAIRFNVFDYLDTLELGLSKLIADLLDPSAAHGQGALFLKTFFHLFLPDLLDSNLDFSGAQVTVEKLIPKQRRIDVFVRIPCEQADFCLAFENKPYAADQKDQVNDYLNYLKGSYSRNFLLIYLSPRGEMPTDWSIKREDLESWSSRFAVMPYVNEHIGDHGGVHDSNELKDSQNFLTNGSLVDWIAKCRHSCDVERLRLFLGDAERFCHTTFGRSKMGSSNEIQTLKDYLETNPDLLDSAQIVYDTWPVLKQEICKRFLNQVFDRISSEIKKKFPDEDLKIDWKLGVKPSSNSRLWLYRESWKQYKEGMSSDSKGRTSIRLSSYRPNLKRWMVGISSPMPNGLMSDDYKRVRRNLERQLSEKGIGDQSNRWWPSFQNLKEYDWNVIIPRLHKECSCGGGVITEYYVNEFVAVLDQDAISIIDGTESLNDEE